MRRPPRVAIVVASTVIGCCAVLGQEPLPPIQFGVPYRCADGTAYVIERCEPARRGEVCFYRIEQAGQQPTNVYNTRAQLTGILKSCPAQSAAQPPAPGAVPAPPQRAAPPAPAALPRPQPGSQSGQRADALLAPDDPGERAARRCVELGGNELECAGKGFVKGLFGGGIAELLSGTNPGRSGMTMTGIYEAGSVNLSFSDDAVTMNGCGKLVSESRPYSVAVTATGFAVTVEAEPKPIRLHLGAGGVLAGPGAVDIKGKVITGYRNVWMQQYRNGSPLVAGECGGGPCGYWAQEPVYAPKTERCTVGAMRPSGPNISARSPIEAAVSVVPGLSPAEDLPAPGVRLTGHYSGAGGLLLEFDADRVILDCGEAHAAKSYTVQFAAGQGVVHVANDATPFTAVVEPDGRLAGSGTTEVLGRVVSRVAAGGIAFSPRRARCAVGTLTPGAADAASRTAPATSPGASGPATLSLASRFPAQRGDPNPLSGVTMYMLRESFADIATRSGVRTVSGQTAVEAWGAACTARAPECAQARQAAQSFLAGTATLDTDGRGVFDALPAGSYHLFGWISYGGQHLVWDLPVVLKAGSNGIALEPGNAVALK